VKFQVLIEFDPDTRSYSATVPGHPVFVSARSERDVLKLVKESLQLYLEDNPGGRAVPHPEHPAKAKVVTVDVHGEIAR